MNPALKAVARKFSQDLSGSSKIGVSQLSKHYAMTGDVAKKSLGKPTSGVFDRKQLADKAQQIQGRANQNSQPITQQAHAERVGIRAARMQKSRAARAAGL